VDEGRFDEWTRQRSLLASRRVALRTTSGLLAGVATGLGLAWLDDTEAKRRRKRRKKKNKRKRKNKKKCTSLLTTCDASMTCCAGLNCGTPTGTSATACCRPPQAACITDGECCAVPGTTSGSACRDGQCCRTNGNVCGADSDCCPGQVCLLGCKVAGVSTCCTKIGGACTSPIECCNGCGFDCVAGVCCRADGQGCDEANPCCNGSTCLDGMCKKN
jgi:hypothetical protein